MKKYKVSTWDSSISEVEAESETKSFVTINGRRDAKASSYASYFDTYAQAWECAEGQRLKSIRIAQSDLDRSNRELEKFLAKYPKP